MLNEEYLKKFRRCVNEYANFGVSEDDLAADASAPAAPADPAMGAAPAPGAMADPSMGAAPADPAMGAAPADPTMGGDQNAAAPADPTMGGDPNAAAPAEGGEEKPTDAEGFSPEGEDVNSMNNQNDEGEEDTEEIEVDDLIDSQEDSEKKIDRLTGKFEKLMGKLDSVEQMINSNNEKISRFEAEMEKRNPTPEEKLTLRSKDSYPFNVSPMDYWKEKEATSNYSTEDDNNGADMPEYKITKDDIGSNWQSISKTFDDERKGLGLRDIFGY